VAQNPVPKPPLVLTAAVLLFVTGALNILGGIQAIGLGGSIGLFFGVLGLAVGAASIYAGVQILALKEQGRITGIVVAAIGIGFGVFYIANGYTPSIIGVVLNGFILYALTQTKSSFSR
jgi:hypothetical protein